MEEVTGVIFADAGWLMTVAGCGLITDAAFVLLLSEGNVSLMVTAAELVAVAGASELSYAGVSLLPHETNTRAATMHASIYTFFIFCLFIDFILIKVCKSNK
jgi:hypothetical protein